MYLYHVAAPNGVYYTRPFNRFTTPVRIHEHKQKFTTQFTTTCFRGALGEGYHIYEQKWGMCVPLPTPCRANQQPPSSPSHTDTHAHMHARTHAHINAHLHKAPRLSSEKESNQECILCV